MKNHSNEELLKLIADAAAELEKRRQENETESSHRDSDEDEGGDRPQTPKFP